MNISIKNLNKKYQGRIVLDDINLDIQSGKIVSILGSSGCGKTTLAKCILGLESFDGEITIDNVPLDDYLKLHRIGYVPQRFANFEHLTVMENLEIVFDKKSSEHYNHIYGILKIFGLFGYKDMYPKDLSGGMKQRLAIARALMVPADIIIFDEPLSALDIETKYKIQELLLSIWNKEKKTFIFITHDIEEAIYMSHQIVVLETNPGKVRSILPVHYEYPRSPSIRFEKEFQDIRKSLSFIIRSESIKGSLVRDIHNESITLGLYMWPGNAPFYYAEETGMFNNLDNKVEIVSFSDTEQKDNYFFEDKVNVLHITINRLKEFQEKYSDVVVLAHLDKSFGADGIITTLPINNFSELRGTIVGVEKDEVSHLFLKYVLEKNNMSERDIDIRFLKTEDLGNALISNSLKTVVLWEPWLSKTIELTNARVVADTTTYDAPLDNILICKKDYYEKNKESLEKIIATFKKSVQVYKNNEKEFIKMVYPIVGLSESELQKTLKKVIFTP